MSSEHSTMCFLQMCCMPTRVHPQSSLAGLATLVLAELQVVHIVKALGQMA